MIFRNNPTGQTTKMKITVRIIFDITRPSNSERFSHKKAKGHNKNGAPSSTITSTMETFSTSDGNNQIPDKSVSNKSASPESVNSFFEKRNLRCIDLS